MTYKNRLIFLVIIIAALAAIYTGSIIVNIDFKTESETYAWLDPQAAEKVSRILLKTEYEEFELSKRNDIWMINHDGYEYPARQLRVADFLSIFTTRAQWPVRSSSESSHERFGLDDSASRITIYGEYSVILDLLLGKDDVMGMDTYFLKIGQNDVRSGDNNIKAYMTNAVSGWYNFRIIPESETGSIDSGIVQRVSVYSGRETQVFTRSNMGWNISGINVTNPDINAIENYVRNIISAEGDNFINDIDKNDPMFNKNRIELEFGTGRRIIIRASDPNIEGRRYVNISGREQIYSLPPWASARLFKDASSFEMQ